MGGWNPFSGAGGGEHGGEASLGALGGGLGALGGHVEEGDAALVTGLFMLNDYTSLMNLG